MQLSGCREQNPWSHKPFSTELQSTLPGIGIPYIHNFRTKSSLTDLLNFFLCIFQPILPSVLPATCKAHTKEIQIRPFSVFNLFLQSVMRHFSSLVFIPLAVVCIHIFLPDTDHCCIQSSLWHVYYIYLHRMTLTATVAVISVPPSVFGWKMHNSHKYNSYHIYMSKIGKSQLLQVHSDSVI